MPEWYGELTEQNVERVAGLIRERLEGKTFAIASALYLDGPDPRLELRTGCTLRTEWTDGGPEPVRVWGAGGKDGEKYVSFSAGHYLWMFMPWEKPATRFAFDHDGFEVSFTAPSGARHKHYFRAEPEKEEN